MLRIKHTKLIAYIIMTILLIGCINVNFAYADSDVTIKVGDATINNDGTYSVPVRIENNSGLAGVMFKLNYDTNVLQVENVTPASGLFSSPIINTSNAGTVNYVYVAATNEKSNGTIYTVNFKSVSKDACTTELTISDIDLCDSNLKSVTGNGSNNKITVSAGSSNNNSSDSDSNANGNTNNGTESSTGSNSNNGTTADSANDNKPESAGTEVSANDNAENENAANEPSSTSSSDNNNNDNENNNISKYIIIGAIVIMCGICAAMGIMWYKAK